MPQTQKIRGVATSVRTDDGWTHVRYHQTDVVSFNEKFVILRTGGWFTVTTKLRMNQTVRQFGLWHGGVCSEQGEWSVYVNATKEPWETVRQIRFGADATLVLRREKGSVVRESKYHQDAVEARPRRHRVTA